MPRISKSVETECKLGFPGAGGQGTGEWPLMGTGFPLEMIKI